MPQVSSNLIPINDAGLDKKPVSRQPPIRGAHRQQAQILQISKKIIRALAWLWRNVVVPFAKFVIRTVKFVIKNRDYFVFVLKIIGICAIPFLALFMIAAVMVCPIMIVVWPALYLLQQKVNPVTRK